VSVRETYKHTVKPYSRRPPPSAEVQRRRRRGRAFYTSATFVLSSSLCAQSFDGADVGRSVGLSGRTYWRYGAGASWTRAQSRRTRIIPWSVTPSFVLDQPEAINITRAPVGNCRGLIFVTTPAGRGRSVCLSVCQLFYGNIIIIAA